MISPHHPCGAMEAVTSFLDSRFEWFCDPTKWAAADDSGEVAGSGGRYEISADGSSLTLKAPAFKDFWSKTFYTPLLVKSDAGGYLCRVPAPQAEEVTVKVDFSYSPVTQFDQAGILVYINDTHWMKCGIEYCDGSARLSVVICNEFSDWSTQPWPALGARLKVHTVAQSSSIVIEAAPLGSEDYQFVRIGHLDSVLGADGAPLPWRTGPFAACPGPQRGCTTAFTSFSLGPRETSVHSADLSDY